MNELLLGLFMWVCASMGVDPKTIETPKFQQVSVRQMAEIMCGPNAVKCSISPAIYDGKSCYIIDEVDFTSSKLARSVVVHHLVHYIQFTKINKVASEMINNMPAYEKEAVEIQDLYMNLVEI